ncbi:MAG: hypothetical protein ABI443_02460, partial [Chthoniobacterales bacterium]
HRKMKMKTRIYHAILVAISILALEACVHHIARNAPGISTLEVESSLSALDHSLSDAKKYAKANEDHVSRAKTLSQRIDYKATILEEH